MVKVIDMRPALRILGLGLLMWCGVAAALDVDVAVNPNPPVSGESFRIAFEVRGELDEPPDFSPLEQRFDVLGRSQQTSIQWVNGKHTRTTTFVLEVLAKAGAPLEVPSIAFDDFHTRPLKLTPVGSAPAAPQDEGLFLEIEAEPRDPYVQQQVTYTIRLWRRYELSNASLSQPRLRSDGMVRALGEDRQYEAERNGKRYEVVERKFAVFPQISGRTVIEPVTVTAQVLERAASLFEMFGRAVKTRRISSEPIELDVRPIPDTFPRSAAWLPARKVRLNELWEPADLRVRTGDPVTHTLSLWVSGLTSGQLPELTPPIVSGLKTYPDQPQLKEDQQNGLITSIRQEKVALIPSAEGELTLPALEIPWWNVDTDALEYARLPAHTLIATADPAAAPAPPPPPVAAATPTVPATTVTPPLRVAPTAPADWQRWRGWLVIAVVALIGWPLSLIWVIRRVATTTKAPLSAMAAKEAVSARAAREAVLKACRTHDPQAARDALLVWATRTWPAQPPVTLGAIAARVTAPLAQAIRALDAVLYGRAANAWQGEALSAAFTAHTHVRAAPGAVDTLPKIFRLAS